MNHRMLTGIWLAGAILALVVYQVGPDRFLFQATHLSDYLLDRLNLLLLMLSTTGFDLLRSAAIALFVVFVVLALLALRCGLRARGALIVVSIVFLSLARIGQAGSATAWTGALLLALFAGLTITGRLVRAPNG